jgi:hypothetical protein
VFLCKNDNRFLSTLWRPDWSFQKGNDLNYQVYVHEVLLVLGNKSIRNAVCILTVRFVGASRSVRLFRSHNDNLTEASVRRHLATDMLNAMEVKLKGAGM